MTKLKTAWFSWAAGCVSAFSKDVSAGLFSQTSFRGGGYSICLLFHWLQPMDGTFMFVLFGQSEQRHWGAARLLGWWDSYGAQFEWEVTKIWGCILEKLFLCGTGSDQRQSGPVSVWFCGQQWAAHHLDTGDGPLSAGGSGWVQVLFSLHQGLSKKALVQTRSFCSVAKCCPSYLRLLGLTAMWPCRSLLNWQRDFSPFCKFAFPSLIIIPGLYLPLDAQAMFLFTSP